MGKSEGGKQISLKKFADVMGKKKRRVGRLLLNLQKSAKKTQRGNLKKS